jgi:hypothetical protein
MSLDLARVRETTVLIGVGRESDTVYVTADWVTVIDCGTYPEHATSIVRRPLVLKVALPAESVFLGR